MCTYTYMHTLTEPHKAQIAYERLMKMHTFTYTYTR